MRQKELKMGKLQAMLQSQINVQVKGMAVQAAGSNTHLSFMEKPDFNLIISGGYE